MNPSVISQTIDSKFDMSRDDQLLKTISYIGDAVYDSYENRRHRPCLPQTRVDILHKITDWATSHSDKHIFWLRGQAGTGKSTIALTMAKYFDQPGDVILASFFFKRGSGDLARSRKVISTITRQLAARSRLISPFVCEALQENPSLGDSASLSQQYDKLLLRPLQRARRCGTHAASYVVVLDALDECDDLDDVRLLLRLLGDTQNMAYLGLRVLVTSRPEIPVRLGFHDMDHIVYHELTLHDVPRAVVDNDIRTFVTHELRQIRLERQLPEPWPENDQIETVTTRAEGLFIYAATVCRYVNGPWPVSPSKRLEQVCQADRVKHKVMEPLDAMYATILASSVTEDFSAAELHLFITCLRQVMGGIVLLFENMSAEALAGLLSTTIPITGLEVQQTLSSLHSVVDVPEDLSKPIQTLHLSFRDFLVDRNRCLDARFRIDEQQMHRDLSDCCLGLMSRFLTRNICQLPSPGAYVKDISETSLRKCLSVELKYACRHWVGHLHNGEVNLLDDGPVHCFLQRYCLYWLEVMSLISKLSEAVTMINQLGKSINVTKPSKSIDNVF
jgi:hypothetical protein